MIRILFFSLALIYSCCGFSQLKSDSANSEYQEYLKNEVIQMWTRGVTDTASLDSHIVFSDYSIHKLSDTLFTIKTKRGQEYLLPSNFNGMVLRGLKKGKKNGFWIYVKPNSILIERWKKGEFKSRRYIYTQ